MATNEDKKFIKDLIVGAFYVVLLLLGYMMNLQLSEIKESIKKFTEFQMEQIKETTTIKGDINLLKAKDIELENKLQRKP